MDAAHWAFSASQTSASWTPRPADLDLRDLHVPETAVEAALRVDTDEWREEIAQHAQWLRHLGRTVPRALMLQHELLGESLEIATHMEHPVRTEPSGI